MAWPAEIYCATVSAGVYRTTNFSDPGTQPTWATVNTGLAGTAISQFGLDPFAPGLKQYCLCTTDNSIYIRSSGGSWTSILTPAQCNALVSDTGSVIINFFLDPSIAGRIWVSFGGGPLVAPQSYNAAYSSNYGSTWTVVTEVYSGNYTRYIGWVAAIGDNVWYTGSHALAGPATCWISTNRGATWPIHTDLSLTTAYGLMINPLSPTIAYTGNHTANYNAVSMTTGGVIAYLGVIKDVKSADLMWFDPVTVAHQRFIAGGKVYVTNDSWATVNSPSAVTPAPINISPWSGADTNQMLVGLTPASGSQPHSIGVLYGESDTTTTGIAGTNCETTPFANSIPDTCGGPCAGGIAAVSVPAPYLYVGEVVFV